MTLKCKISHEPMGGLKPKDFAWILHGGMKVTVELNSSNLGICGGETSVFTIKKTIPWAKVFRIIPEFRNLRLIFQRKSASKC